MTTLSLLHFNGTDASTTITDTGGSATWAVLGNAQLDTAQKKFGTASLLCDGTGDYVQSANIGALPASGGWTIDWWVRFNTLSAYMDTVHWFVTGPGKGVEVYWDIADSKLHVNLSANGSSNGIAAGTAGTAAFATGTQYHIEITRDDAAAAYYVYVDGVLDITVSSASQISSSIDTCRIGSFLNGWIDEFRVVSGSTHPGGISFTPPTTETGASSAEFNLPALTLTGTGTVLGFLGNLPMLTLAAGNPSAIFNLPMLTLSTAGAQSDIGVAEFALPLFTLAANGGTPAHAIFNLPALTLVAAGSAGGVGLSLFPLPTLRLSLAEGVTGDVGTAEFNLPLLTLAVVAHQNGLGAGAFSLPVLALSAIGETGGLGVAAFELPVLTLSIAAFQSITGTAAFNLPILQLSAQGAAAVTAAYRTWVLNTRKNALTEYTNFSFNSFARFNGQNLACGPGGVVVLGAQALDGSTAITGRYRTGQAEFGSSWHKRVPRIFLDGAQDGDLLFRAITVEGGARTYQLTWNKISGQTQRRVPVGKGPRSRFWQFECENMNGADFSSASLLTYPQTLRRRVS